MQGSLSSITIYIHVSKTTYIYLYIIHASVGEYTCHLVRLCTCICIYLMDFRMCERLFVYMCVYKIGNVAAAADGFLHEIERRKKKRSQKAGETWFRHFILCAPMLSYNILNRCSRIFVSLCPFFNLVFNAYYTLLSFSFLDLVFVHN